MERLLMWISGFLMAFGVAGILLWATDTECRSIQLARHTKVYCNGMLP